MGLIPNIGFIFVISISILKANIGTMGEILIKHKVKKRIKESVGASYPTIRLALLGETDTDLAKQIRTKALELGGVEVEPEK